MRKAAFVTGGSRGIGRGIAKALAQAGYDIAFTYNTKLDEAITLKEEIESLGRKCYFYQASMEKDDVPEEVTAQAISDLGRLDVLVCNAGLTVHNSILKLTAEDIDFSYNLDYRSYILCTKVAANHMAENDIQGRIIFITSTRGIRAYPEDPLYGGMKAALNRAIETLALDLSDYGITVNAIAPGATAIRGNFTPEELRASRFAQKIPAGRMGTPREVGGLVRYLVSEDAGYITGTVIKMDGGLILGGMPEDASPESGPSWSRLPDYLK